MVASVGTDKRLCVHRIDDLGEVACGSFPAGHKGSVDPRSVTWSPDSTRLAFHENLFLFLEESDIWTMDAATGAIHDLTDDRATGNASKIEGEAWFDVAECWSPDGTQLAFARSPKTHDLTDLMTVATDGSGAPVMRGRISTTGLAVYFRPQWLGDQVLYTVTLLSKDDPGSGIWRMAASGGQPQQLLGGDAVKGPPSIGGASADGSLVIAVYEGVIRTFASAREAFALLRTDDLRVEPIRAPATTQPGSAFVLGAALSPDGRRLAYVYRGAGDYQLVVRDLTTGAERSLGDAQRVPFGMVGDTPGLIWPTPDRLFAAGVGGAATLFTLGSGGAP